jgi:hypothetical protein
MAWVAGPAKRAAGGAAVVYAESSMVNGFGLHFVHRFFNLPYLTAVRKELLKRLETNATDLTGEYGLVPCASVPALSLTPPRCECVCSS